MEGWLARRTAQPIAGVDDAKAMTYTIVHEAAQIPNGRVQNQQALRRRAVKKSEKPHGPASKHKKIDAFGPAFRSSQGKVEFFGAQ
jgi:hypothetical protein